MIEQLKTIRAGLETATCYSMLGVDAHSVQLALTALTQLEAMVGEPVAWRPISTAPRDGTNIMLRFGQDSVSQGKFVLGVIGHPWKFIDSTDGVTWLTNHAVDGPGGPSHWMPMPYAAPVAQQYEAGDVASAAAQGFRDGVASVTQQEQVRPCCMNFAAGTNCFSDPRIDCPHLPTFAQQPQARPDFNDEWTGYLKDGETPFERFLRERKDLQSMLRLYQRALEENERLKGQQPQAEAVPLPPQVMVDMVPPATARDRWMYEQGRLAERDPRTHAAPQQAEAVPPDVVRDAERWRMLPAYFYEYQIDAMKLYRDIDAAIAQQKGASHE